MRTKPATHTSTPEATFATAIFLPHFHRFRPFPPSAIRVTQGLATSTYICASATALLPCSSGPDSTSATSTTSQSFNFGSLLGHWIYNLNANYSVNRNQQAEPNLQVNGMLVPLVSSGANSSLNLSTSLNKLVRRHTISASISSSADTAAYTSTYNASQSVQNAVAYRTFSAELSDAVKASDKLSRCNTRSRIQAERARGAPSRRPARRAGDRNQRIASHLGVGVR